MTAASIISRSASGSATFPKRDSTCQRRARKPSTWSVIPAMPKTTPAGQLGSWPACTINTTKMGISPRRATVRAVGSWASGCGTAEAGSFPGEAGEARPEELGASMAEGYGRLLRMLSRVPELPRIPGFVDAHCHAFQRALRGRTEGEDFWAWRETMLELAAEQTPERVRREYVEVYRELRAAGYTAVGEFHYLGLEEAPAAAEAAAQVGIELVLLHVAYARGGIDRFRQGSVAAYLRELEDLRAGGIRVGVAPHSVRACPREWLVELGRYAAEHELPLHVHADEQPREIAECLAEHGRPPIALLDACGCLGPRSTVGPATHA